MAWVIDLDGVVRLGSRMIPGADEAVAALRSAGEVLAFVTNNSSHRHREVVDQLRKFGIEVEPDEVTTSATAVASLVEPGERVLLCAGPGVHEAVRKRGAGVVENAPADVVIVGFTREFDYDLLDRASSAVRGGARFLASNSDVSYPGPNGLAPGAGALVAAVAAAAGRGPDAIAGKPHEPMVALVRDRLGPRGVVVGDRADTDGLFARALAYRFALVMSGVVGDDELEQLDPAPDIAAADLLSVVRAAL